MTGEDLDKQAQTCYDCGTPLDGPFCHRCGLKRQPLQQPVHHFVRDATVELLGVDGRLWRTLRLLLTKPGELTRAYVTGQRSRYLRPLRVYLSTTLLFFFLLSIIDPTGQIEEQLMSGVRADTTATASSRYEIINKRLRDDSTGVAALDKSINDLERQVAEDTTASEALVRSLDQQRMLRASRVARNALRRQRFLWQQEVLTTYPPDSLVQPRDLSTASEWVFPGNDSGNDGFNFSTNLPEWAIRNPALARLQGSGTREERMQAGMTFLRGMIGRLPAVMFLLLPVFALLLKPIYARKRLLWVTTPIRSVFARIRGVPSRGRPAERHYYADHLVFGLHTHAFAFAIFSIIVLLSFVGRDMDVTKWVTAGLSVSIPIYFVIAMRRVYDEGWFKTLFKSWILFSIYSLLVLLLGFALAFLLAAVLG